jgi:O-antigen/teichoic acid export membrane protein
VIRQTYQAKLGSDLFWTFGSFAILAVCGVLLNVVVAILRDATALGVFNIAYAAYLIGSQLAVIGVHYSVLRHAAYYVDDAAERGSMLGSAILLSSVLGLFAGAALYVFAPLAEPLFKSIEVAESLRYAAFGLLLFPLNKVLISYINGMRFMRAFSVLQSLRYITVLFSVTAVCFTDLPFTYATLSFFIAEALTSVATIFYLARNGHLRGLKPRYDWLKKHLVFGSKGAFGGIFLDMNTRLDVLLLGVFLSERDVGIYSFAAMLVDGIQHLLAIVRVNFNPILVTALRDQKWEESKRLLHLSRRYVTLGVVAISLAILAGFWIAVTYLAAGKGFEEGMVSLIILLGTFILIGGYSPFDNLLMVTGHPGYQTFQILTITLVNVSICTLLVPHVGIEGAAIGTALGYFVGTMMTIVLGYHLLGWNMLRNHVTVKTE